MEFFKLEIINKVLKISDFLNSTYRYGNVNLEFCLNRENTYKDINIT